MNTAKKDLGKCKVELNVTLEPAEAKNVVKDVERAFVREVRLPGFRPGKVPLEMIRKQFSKGLAEETKRAMVRKHLDDAIKAAELDAVNVAEVKDESFGEEGGSFTAVVEVKPVFELPEYKGIAVTANDTTVSDAMVSEQIDRLRKAYAKYEDAKEGDAVAEGDFVQIDYTGTVDGKPILEINPEAKVVASGTGFWTQVEEGRFLAEILEALKGMKAGETKDGVKAKFDKDAAPEGLKGAEAVYSVTLKSFRRRLLPGDAELAEKAKAESFEKMVADMREAMEKNAVQQEAVRRENEAIETLLKKVEFDVPECQVERQTAANLDSMSQRMQYAGVGEEYVREHGDKILADAKAMAEKQVRVYYILRAIAKAEKIEGKDEEINQKAIDVIVANLKK